MKQLCLEIFVLSLLNIQIENIHAKSTKTNKYSNSVSIKFKSLRSYTLIKYFFMMPVISLCFVFSPTFENRDVHTQQRNSSFFKRWYVTLELRKYWFVNIEIV